MIKIEYIFPSGEEACRPLSISFDFRLTCGHLLWHLRWCGVDIETNKFAVDIQVIDVYMKVALFASAREQLQATPGVLRVTVVHTADSGRWCDASSLADSLGMFARRFLAVSAANSLCRWSVCIQ